MVNLIAEKKVVPELMQNEMTGERIAAESAPLLDNVSEREKMKAGLARVAQLLDNGGADPISRAADEVEVLLGLKEN
jgi:lipid-A-disaccharide synthase